MIKIAKGARIFTKSDMRKNNSLYHLKRMKEAKDKEDMIDDLMILEVKTIEGEKMKEEGEKMKTIEGEVDRGRSRSGTWRWSRPRSKSGSLVVW